MLPEFCIEMNVYQERNERLEMYFIGDKTKLAALLTVIGLGV